MMVVVEQAGIFSFCQRYVWHATTRRVCVSRVQTGEMIVVQGRLTKVILLALKGQ